MCDSLRMPSLRRHSLLQDNTSKQKKKLYLDGSFVMHCVKNIGLTLWRNATFCREFVSYDFPLVFPAYKTNNISALVLHTWRLCLNLNEGPTYFSSLRAKLILALLGMPKWVWPLMNQYRMFFVQTSTPPPRMHQKLTKHGKFCKQNNQLPTKSHDELKDNSII
jgi:hypothetical protein